MSLTLVTNPVQTVGGVVQNLFAGFAPVEFKFKREDLQIFSVGLGIDNNILITTNVDLTSYLSVGDSIYLYAQGLTYTYDLTAQIVEITTTTITINGDYIEGANGGYINYLKNYYVECQLVNVNNSNIKVLSFSLNDDGDNAGNITIDVSIANDKNIQEFIFETDELTESRIVFKMQYRQVYTGSSESFTLVDDEIILVYATEQPEIESFINQLDLPTFYKGYPFGVILVHSSQNNDDTGIDVVFDELDINQVTLTSANVIGSIDANLEGFIFINFDKDFSYNVDTEYIELKASYSGFKFFDPAYFDNTFFDA